MALNTSTPVTNAAEYTKAVDELYALGHELHNLPSSKFELWQMRELTSALESPQKQFPAVLIAGTNGKGSTSAMLASILQEAGYKVGLYTSPHLVRINERIHVNGTPISDVDFTEAYQRVLTAANTLIASSALPHSPSFFEMLTAIAFVHFASVKVEIAVLEAGMGGRLDATNIVEPLLSIITDIDLDHQKFLGNTLAAIAAEKAGILRRDVPAITLRQRPEVDGVLNAAIENTGALPASADAILMQLEVLHSSIESEDGSAVLLEPALHGRHQSRNMALAVKAALELQKSGFKITLQQVASGVRQTRWPARMQYFPAKGERPALLLDVAHNPAGARVLYQALDDQYRHRAKVFVFGALRDKDIAGMASVLFSHGEQVIATTAANPRAASAEEVSRIVDEAGGTSLVCNDIPGALHVAFDEALRMDAAGEPRPMVVVCGSIYIVGEAMKALDIEV